MNLKAMYKTFVVMLAMLMLSLPGTVFAGEAASTSLQPIGTVKPGEAFTVKGTTSLPQLLVRILRPNKTVLELDQITAGELAAGKTVTLPASAPTGTYTVEAGIGTDVTSVSFTAGAGTPAPGGTEDPGGTEEPGPSAPPPSAPIPGGQVPPAPGPSSGPIVLKPALSGPSGLAAARLSDMEWDQAIGQAADGKVAVVLEKAAGAKSYEVQLPAVSLNGTKPEVSLHIKSEFAELTLPGRMLGNSNPGQTGTVVLRITQAAPSGLPQEAKAAVGSRPVLNLSLQLNGQDVAWSNMQAPVTVSVPYSPSAAERSAPEQITVRYIDGMGRALAVPNAKYDPTAGTVTFRATHFSVYAVAYIQPTFTDLGAHAWAKKPIEVLAAKGIIQGMTPASFAPESNITRADFMLLLVRTLELGAAFKDNFADVRPDDYYYGALGVAKSLGISQGSEGNRFLPQQEITRQEMMTLTARALKAAGKLKQAGSASELSRFADAGSVAPYAADSIAALLKNGIVTGDGSGIRPLGQATRAETAVMMYRIYNQ
ncbi:S-layer homology domain-containing protein [Gorillibacterium sp. sgz5001074]|uniref:S-layer homology domain-containing protein n=1 Tax=Gorillibacterium sp. sgz5001074 TaxID=3446695 RepID=UPI003F66FE06